VIEVGDEIRVLVEDRGRGFEAGAATDGFGLLGMRERVVLGGGSLAVRSAPGDGTAITAVLPARRRPTFSG
jgi:signal transduction histidine kinase